MPKLVRHDITVIMKLRFLTAGESHGPAEVAIIEGVPAGLTLSKTDINKELKKRMHDIGRGGRGNIETDKVEILAGVRHGKTLGSPIALLVANKDYANWNEKMSSDPVESEVVKVTKPRPGHADLSGVLKYGFDDVRNVLERASARETVMRVAVGAVCKKLLAELGILVASHTVQLGNVRIEKDDYSFEEVATVFETDPQTRCVDPDAREKMKQAVLKARMEKDTLGGVVEIIAVGVPIGLGSYVHYDRKLDGRIAQALMSVPSVKAVEIGNAIKASGLTGSQVQDAITVSGKSISRKTNNMGGLEGGMTNGEPIVVRTYHKPLSTIYDPLPTVDIKSGEQTTATVERSDVVVVGRGGVVSESMLAYVLADAVLEKFGGDNVSELKTNYINYKKSVKNNFEFEIKNFH